MASRSATVLVIFTVAVLAFCFATVFASMTGPLNLFNNDTGGILDNLSAITDNNDNGYDSGRSQSYDYSEDYSSSDNVESYTEPSSDTSSSDSDHSSPGDDASGNDKTPSENTQPPSDESQGTDNSNSP